MLFLEVDFTNTSKHHDFQKTRPSHVEQNLKQSLSFSHASRINNTYKIIWIILPNLVKFYTHESKNLIK